MTSARRIRALIDALTAGGGSASEGIDRLDVRGRLDQVQLAGWSDVMATIPFVGVTSVSAMDAFGDEVDLRGAALGLVGQELRIQVWKAKSATTAFCLTADGVSAVFADFEASASVRQVWVACDFEPFKTESCRIDPWDDDASDVPTQDDEVRIPDPRRLVKDFVGARVPKNVFPYILMAGEPMTSNVFERWKDLAVVRLLNSLVNEVQSTDGEQVVITGTRPRKIDNDLKPPFSGQLFTVATDVARWVYASGRDVDTRFALFTYELSREWPEGLTFKDGFAARGQLALEAANTAFRAHVQETSKDTLKSLGDLRKTLSEEVTKVVSQTRDLMATMWRDFMIAATSFLGRVVLLGSDKPLSNPWPLKALLSGAAAFLLFSLVLSLRTNAKFMVISDASRAEWRRKLYGFMNNEDFQKLSDVPLDESSREYKRVARWVVVAYVAVIGCLLWTAWGTDAKTNGASQSYSQLATGASAVPAPGASASQPAPTSSASAALPAPSAASAGSATAQLSNVAASHASKVSTQPVLGKPPGKVH